MQSLRITVIALAAICAFACRSTAATLTVTVSGMNNHKGQLRVGLFARPEGWMSDKAAVTGQNVLLGTVTGDVAVVTFDNVKAGDYAVGVYHDENMNFKLDKKFFGVPKEQWGVSDNVKPHLRAPTYDEARFSIAEPSTSIRIELHK